MTGLYTCTCAKLCARLRPTPCDPTDGSPPGSSVHGTPQAGILECGCCFLPWGFFPTRVSNLHLLHKESTWRIPYHWATWETHLYTHIFKFFQILFPLRLKVNASQSCPTLCAPWTIQAMGFSSQNTGVGSPSLLRGIFPPQGLNWGLPHWRRILYQLSPQGSPGCFEMTRTTQWTAMLTRMWLWDPANWVSTSLSRPVFT